ncbi:MAG: hypothetical protein EOO99_00055 [Pedobacter sp.]|nr:MAG: hypothetical protein EOO99_00055 [Pedobacter sp.]
MPLRLYPLLLCATLFFACTSDNSSNTDKQKGLSKLLSTQKSEPTLFFGDVAGIRYYEVRRTFRDGLSFNKDGFQQEPSWQIEVIHKDSIYAYDPNSKRMEKFFLQNDHGKVYNFAREFFRVKTITRDSMVLQRLYVSGKIIAADTDYRSQVYCTFYSKDYIEKTLKTTVDELRKPSAADSAFVKSLIQKSNADPGNRALVFAARQPVQFQPNSPNVKTEKISTIDVLNKRMASVDYLYPYFKLTINKAYREFNYSFHVVVDAKGKLYVSQVEGVLPEDYPHRQKLLQGICDVYLQNLFHIIPGKTLNIPHSSDVRLTVIGKK